MTYAVMIEEMVGMHVAGFQAELILARQARCIKKGPPPMPYGYPIQVYHPHHVRILPRTLPARRRGAQGTLSNQVPWVLGLKLVNDHVLGLYNPQPH